MQHFLIDGYNLSFRCFHAMPELSRSDGYPTGAIHAFFASILKLASLNTPHQTTLFFDCGKSLRHINIYPDYKANRASAPDNFKRQIPSIKELCLLLGYDVIQQEGIEADDLLASFATKLKDNDISSTIVSADKDFAQLISPKIKQLLPPTPKNKIWSELDIVGVRSKFGVSPKQIPDFLALVGDSADNIKGLDGVGPKTAAKLLNEFESLDKIIHRWDWIKPTKLANLVKDNQERLRLNLEMVSLVCDIDMPITDLKHPDWTALMNFLDEMEMKKSQTTLKNFARQQYLIEL